MKNLSILAKLLGGRDPGTTVKRRLATINWPRNVPVPEVEREGNPPHIIPPIAPMAVVPIALLDKVLENIGMEGLAQTTHVTAALFDKLVQAITEGGDFTPIITLVDKVLQDMTTSGAYTNAHPTVPANTADEGGASIGLQDGEYFVPRQREFMSEDIGFIQSPYGLVIVPIVVPSEMTNQDIGFLQSPYILIIVAIVVPPDALSEDLGFIQSPYTQVVQVIGPLIEFVTDDVAFTGGTNPDVVRATGLLVESVTNDTGFSGGSYP